MGASCNVDTLQMLGIESKNLGGANKGQCSLEVKRGYRYANIP